MGTDSITDAPLGPKVSAFLKAEAFYVAVLIFVAVTSAAQTASSFAHEYTDRPVSLPLDQKILRSEHYRELTELMRTDIEAAWFPTAVVGFNLLLLIAGSALILCLALAWFVKERKPVAMGAPSPVWGLWDVLKASGLFAAGGMLLHLIFRTKMINPFASAQTWIAEIFGYVLLVGVVIHIVKIERGGRLADLGIRPDGLLRAAGFGLLGFLAIQPFLRLAEAAQWQVSKVLPMQEPLQAMLLTQSARTLVLSSFVAVVVAPLGEELLFRGFLQPALQRWIGRGIGILACAAFFAASHMDLFSFPQLFLLGVALGYVYDRTRSLAAPVTLHLLFNGTTVLAIFAHRSLAAISAG